MKKAKKALVHGYIVGTGQKLVPMIVDGVSLEVVRS